MGDKVLSIVVPAYNMEKYLKRCLDSMMLDAILDKIEVLVINDGSTDKTSEIAGEYCKRYPETFFLYEKDNGGHGSGINYGIRYATGRYFKVVDGDDWLNEEELPDFVRQLERVDVDVVASDFLCIQDETGKILSKRYCTSNPSQYGTCCSMKKGEVKNVIKMHALTIKTEILKNNNIRVDEHSFYVDAQYITYPMPYVDSVYFYQRFLYMYRLGRNGQSMDIRSMQKRRNQHMNVLNRMLEYYKNVGDISPENKKYMERCIGQMVESQFHIYISMGLCKGIYTELKQWDERLKQEYPEIYSAVEKKSISMLRKTGYRILPVGALVYKIIK